MYVYTDTSLRRDTSRIFAISGLTQYGADRTYLPQQDGSEGPSVAQYFAKKYPDSRLQYVSIYFQIEESSFRYSYPLSHFATLAGISLDPVLNSFVLVLSLFDTCPPLSLASPA